MSRRRMSFAMWVATHVHYLRAPRLQVLMTYLEAFGPKLSRDIQEHLARPRLPAPPAGARMRVTIDTIQRDLALLLHWGFIAKVDAGDYYEWGGGRRIRIWRYGLASDVVGC